MGKPKFHFYKDFKSERIAIIEIEHVLIKIKNKFKINEDNFYKMMIALTEAVNNAIYHGNKNDPGKIFSLGINVYQGKIEFIINDQGNGFIVSDVPDPRDKDNLTKDHGRGVFLIKSLMTGAEYSFSDKGTSLKMYYEFDNN